MGIKPIIMPGKIGLGGNPIAKIAPDNRESFSHRVFGESDASLFLKIRIKMKNILR